MHIQDCARCVVGDVLYVAPREYVEDSGSKLVAVVTQKRSLRWEKGLGLP